MAIHYGCHLLKPSRIMKVDDPNNPEVLEKLVEALGATPVRHRNWCLCGGSTSKTFLIKRAQWARLEVDVVEDLSVVVSVQDVKHAVNAL